MAGMIRLLIGVLLLAELAVAQNAGGVEYTIDYQWPQEVCKGYVPAHAFLRNTTDRRREVEIVVSLGGGDVLEFETEIEPFGESEHDLLIPIQASGYGAVLFKITVDGKAASPSVIPFTANSPPGGRKAIALYGPSAGEALDELGWRMDADANFAACSYPKRLPTRLAAYTSLDAFILDASDELPNPEACAALAGWVRSGGMMFVSGGDEAVQRVRESRHFEFTFEPRFEDSRIPGMFRFGLGWVGALPAPTEDWARNRQFVSNTFAATSGGTDYMDFRHYHSGAVIPLDQFGGTPFARIPKRGIAALLVLFALLIGPVNMILVEKRSVPAMLLATIPGLSLLFTAGVLGYGIAAQGLDVRIDSKSVTVLDQRSDTVATREHRRFFAGKALKSGLLPGAMTAVLTANLGSGTLDASRRPVVRQTDSAIALEGGFTSVRTPISQVVTTTGKSRLGLDFKVQAEPGGGYTYLVRNNLGVGLRYLWLVTESQEIVGGALPNDTTQDLRLLPLHVGTAGPDAQGDTTEHRERVASSIKEWTSGSLGGIYPGETVAPGTYIAQIERGFGSPFLDLCGLDLEQSEMDNQHVVIGIVDLESLKPQEGR